MKWLDRADQMSFPAKFVITFVCLIFGLATTLATLAPSPSIHSRYAARDYDGGEFNLGGGAPASRSSLSLPITTILDDSGVEPAAATLLPDGEVAGLFPSLHSLENRSRFLTITDKTIWQGRGKSGLDGNLNNLHFVDKKRGWAYSVGKKLYRTIDSGATWQKVKLPIELTMGDMAWLSPQVGFIAGSLYNPTFHNAEVNILRTTDGGRSWCVVGNVASELAVWKLSAPTVDNLLMNVGGVDLYVSSDGGENWQTTFFEGGGIQDFTCNALGEGWIIGQNGRFYGLRNYGGEYDAKQPTGFPRNRSWRAIDINADGVGLALTADHTVALTTDDGITWREAQLAPTETDQVPFLQNLNRVQVRGDGALVANGSKTFRIDLSPFTARDFGPPDVNGVRVESADSVPPPPPPMKVKRPADK